MLVNTASFCGYTYQYAKLQELYDNYKKYNFEIIGFPCNDFGAQEPGKDSVINDFCTNNYGITFRMMSKVNIVTGDTSPIYKWLQHIELNTASNATVSWNFNKFLINEAGYWVTHFTSDTDPLDPAITDWIMTPNVITSTGPDNLNDFFQITSANPAVNSIDLIIKQNLASSYNITLQSIDGKLVYGLIEKNAGNKNISINVSDITPGIYLMKLESGNFQKTIKVIISK